MSTETCGSDGGRGIGAGHVCRCNSPAGHPLDGDHPHGCECGAMWSECYSCQRGVTEPHRCPITYAELVAALREETSA